MFHHYCTVVAYLIRHFRCFRFFAFSVTTFYLILSFNWTHLKMVYYIFLCLCFFKHNLQNNQTSSQMSFYSFYSNNFLWLYLMSHILVWLGLEHQKLVSIWILKGGLSSDWREGLAREIFCFSQLNPAQVILWCLVPSNLCAEVRM